MTSTAAQVGPVFEHLAALTDDLGLFEHALHDQPRPEHGYCVDDVSRALLVLCREPAPTALVCELAEHYLRFTISALVPSGRCHNRMDSSGRWTDEAGLGDWWGRALWGLGVAAANAPTEAMRARALAGFRLAARCRSAHLRAMVFAGLGAAAVLGSRPDEGVATGLLEDAVMALTDEYVASPRTEHWSWPQPRLGYANGSLAELMLLGGSLLERQDVARLGLAWLDFLMRTETRDGHLSVAPVTGRGPDDTGAGFDQQPIEVAAIAEACACAYRLTGDERWRAHVAQAWEWFCGINDSATPMFDEVTGGGYDGLQRVGRNSNQGAESTLAMLSTAQLAHRLQLTNLVN